jgi:hypothetical protein
MVNLLLVDGFIDFDGFKGSAEAVDHLDQKLDDFARQPLADSIAIRAPQRSGMWAFAFDDDSDGRTAHAVSIKTHGEAVDRTTRVGFGGREREEFQLIGAVAVTHGLETSRSRATSQITPSGLVIGLQALPPSSSASTT